MPWFRNLTQKVDPKIVGFIGSKGAFHQYESSGRSRHWNPMPWRLLGFVTVCGGSWGWVERSTPGLIEGDDVADVLQQEVLDRVYGFFWIPKLFYHLMFAANQGDCYTATNLMVAPCSRPELDPSSIVNLRKKTTLTVNWFRVHPSKDILHSHIQSLVLAEEAVNLLCLQLLWWR